MLDTTPAPRHCPVWVVPLAAARTPPILPEEQKRSGYREAGHLRKLQAGALSSTVLHRPMQVRPSLRTLAA